MVVDYGVRKMKKIKRGNEVKREKMRIFIPAHLHSANIENNSNAAEQN